MSYVLKIIDVFEIICTYNQLVLHAIVKLVLVAIVKLVLFSVFKHPLCAPSLPVLCGVFSLCCVELSSSCYLQLTATNLASLGFLASLVSLSSNMSQISKSMRIVAQQQRSGSGAKMNALSMHLGEGRRNPRSEKMASQLVTERWSTVTERHIKKINIKISFQKPARSQWTTTVNKQK